MKTGARCLARLKEVKDLRKCRVGRFLWTRRVRGCRTPRVSDPTARRNKAGVGLRAPGRIA